jgi:hypothetical protein
MKSLRFTFGLLLALYLPTAAQAQQCDGDDRQANLIGKVYGVLAALQPAQQAWFLGHAGCQLNQYPSLKAAIGACSCKPAFGCVMVSLLRRDDKLSANDPHVMACGQ